ncbi:hypothetical protein Patl1_03079 [Pistacia atlantica]|uniref:Uncharacterized protein n=1 Tax=Pistacia atlantica TaxID=434234 RepID=A0ACC1C8W9_9ROSI|nr:hypothetical protein Patl1_03079 [Pistacia atlantica]
MPNKSMIEIGELWSVRVLQAALKCIRKVVDSLHQTSRPKQSFTCKDTGFFCLFDSNPIAPFPGRRIGALHPDGLHLWTSFLHHGQNMLLFLELSRRVGTTYAQLIAALAAANSLGDNSTGLSFSFLSSFQSNLLREGLRFQTGWGHIWNRFAGPLSCHNQPHQCAFTPLLPPAWWDGLWQSPLPRDIQRLAAYGIQLSGFGTIDDNKLQSFCSSKKNSVKTVTII